MSTAVSTAASGATRTAAVDGSPTLSTAGTTRERDEALAADPRILTGLTRRHKERTASPPMVAAVLLAWLVTTLVIALVPDSDSFVVHGQTVVTVLTAGTTVALAVVWLIARRPAGPRRLAASRWLAHWSSWWIAVAVVVLAWDLATAKAGWGRPPYFPPPGQLITEAWSDRVLLGSSVAHSAGLLALGLLIGGATGLATGMWMGWSRRVGYWLSPIVKYIGPVPTLAWIPIVFIAFPNTFWAAVFLVALTVWFPMTVLTNAGIRSVPKEYFDVCQTLGASPRFLVLKVSLPAALPNIFTGIFMALPTAFVALTIAETLGVNAGLGWYINWKKGWSAYPAMYAAIAVMVIFCGTLLTVELAIRNRVLAWQKDLTRW